MDQIDKIIKKLNKLSLPTVILIASLVIGGFYYASEVNKQKSIERQQEMKIQEEKTKTDQIKQEQEQTAKQLQDCLNKVAEGFKGLEGIKNATRDDYNMIIDLIQKQKDDCFKRYPQK
ncbi:hypothetical protein KKE03_03475 [Patescibacteria group bacterium]|nr:hypothetical protein [Patescibacteria group bacterium]